MTIEYDAVGAGTVVTSNSPASLSPPLHASVAEGDLTFGIFFIGSETGTWEAAPAGWSHIPGSPFKGGAGNLEINFAVIYRVQPVTPVAPTLTHDSPGFGTGLAITLTYRGNFGTPINIVGTLFAPGNIGAQSVGPIPGIGPVNAGAGVLCLGFHSDECASHTTLTDTSLPGDESLAWAQAYHESTSQGPDGSIWADHVILPETVTVDDQTFTITGGDNASDGAGIIISFVEDDVPVSPDEIEINSAGDQVALTYPAPVEVGAGGNPTVSLVASSTGALSCTFNSINSATVVYDITGIVDYGETVTLDLTNSTDGLQRVSDGADALDVDDAAVTNLSAVNSPAAPTISSFVVQSNGVEAVIGFSSDVEVGEDGITGLTLTADDGLADPVTMTIEDESDPDLWTVNLSRTVLTAPGGDSPVIDYSTSAEGIRTLDNGFGVPLGNISDQSITNNSTQVLPTVISSVPAEIASEETGIVISGSNFLATQGTGSVNISDGVNNADATVTAWGDTEITVTLPDIFVEHLKPGTVTVTVTNDDGGASNTDTQLTVAEDWAYNTLDTPDLNGDDYFVEADGQPAPESGDLVACERFLHLASDDSETAFVVIPLDDQHYTFADQQSVPSDNYQIRYRFFDDSDHTWGAEGIKSISIVSLPVAISAEVDDTGTQILVTWPDDITDAGNGLGALSVSLPGGAITLALNSGDGTDTHIFDITNRIVLQGEGNGTLSYTQTTDGFRRVSDSEDVASFSIALNNTSNEIDVVPPEIESITIDDDDGDNSIVTVVLSEVVNAGVDGFNDLVLNMSGGVVTLTNTAGDDTDTLTYTPSRTVLGSETGTGEYTQPGDGIKDAEDNLLATIAGLAITNNSTLENNGLDLSTLGPCRENNAGGALLANLNDVRLIVFNAAGSVLFYSTTHSTDAQGDLANVQLPGQSIGTTTYVAAEHIATGFGFGPVAVPVSGL